ncbi:hypothetical protein [Calycomorphotria hydatis]|uniref:FlgN protein n=1 Tax=Calycomorphotria hydatis TaxID=2528027 RepID=A0A517TBB8_9PLAN|nr:hypothetical protein [Calycomorphotria hydatis]QDT65655.1 FlgN protein [Calycomorphotria hydatis]
MAVAEIDWKACLQEQLQYCDALSQLQDRQNAAITSNEYESLILILREKQQWIERLTLLKREQDLTNRWRAERDHLPATERQECEQLLSTIETTLEQLATSQNENIVAITSAQRETQAALVAANNGAAVNSAYTEQAPAPTTGRLNLDG